MYNFFKASFSFFCVIINMLICFQDYAIASSDSTRLVIDQNVVQDVRRPLKSVDSSRVLVALINPMESDSMVMSFRHVLLDSLKNTFNSPRYSNIIFQFMPDDSFPNDRVINEWNDSTLLALGKRNQVDLVISGNMSRDNEQKLCYQPYILVLKQDESRATVYHDERSLSGKICQLNQFHLPVVSIDRINRLTNFLAALFFIQEKKYSDAMSKLTQDDSMPAYFYLGQSYLHRGIATEQNVTSARVDWDSSSFYWRKCLSKSETLRDSICVLNNLGVSFQLQGKLDSALVYFSRANSFVTSLPSHQDFIRITNNLGNIYLLSGQWSRALDFFQANIQALEQASDSLNLAVTYENLGNIYQLILQRSKAITCYAKALELRKLMRDDLGAANSLNFLGDVYQERNEFDTAKDYFMQGLLLNQKLHNEPRIADSCDRLGQVSQVSGDLESALYYYQRSLETYEMLDDKDGIVKTIMHQATVYQKQKDFEKAQALYERALQAGRNNNSKSLQAQIYDRMGDIYNNQENLAQAYDYYQQSADLYEQVENYETLSLVLYSMGLIKLKQNEYAEGYQLIKRAIKLDEDRGFNNLSSEKEFLNQLENILEK